jgi:AraC-like DNA-binding protein
MRYSRIVADAPPASLVEDGEVASLRYAFPVGDWPGLRMGAELAISGALRLLRSFMGASASPRGAFFAYAAPAHHDEYQRIFGDALRFEHAYTGIDFERAWLEQRQLHANPELHAVLEARAMRTLERLSHAALLAERIEAHLSTCDPSRMPGMQAVAAHFGMSPRSLRRRLGEEERHFRAIVEAARAGIARRLLGKPVRCVSRAYCPTISTNPYSWPISQRGMVS